MREAKFAMKLQGYGLAQAIIAAHGRATKGEFVAFN
jgi:hypothetical protein